MNLGKLKMLGNTMLSMSTGKEAKLVEIEILSSNDPYEFTEIWYEFADEDHFWMRWRVAALTLQLALLGSHTVQPMERLVIRIGPRGGGRQAAAITYQYD